MYCATTKYLSSVFKTEQKTQELVHLAQFSHIVVLFCRWFMIRSPKTLISWSFSASVMNKKYSVQNIDSLTNCQSHGNFSVKLNYHWKIPLNYERDYTVSRSCDSYINWRQNCLGIILFKHQRNTKQLKRFWKVS